MSGLSRRNMLKGSLALASVASFNVLGGGRIARAQGAAYDIVSFGPMVEGVMAEGYFLPQFGGTVGITGAGTGFGSIAATAEKFSPALFAVDGTMTKLKSGTYGGEIRAVNAAGNAVGISYDTIAGEGDRFATLAQPAAWVDGEFVRLPVPDPESETDDLIGAARSINDDGLVLGNGNGHQLLWRNGEPEILPDSNAAGDSLYYYALFSNGALIGRRANYSTEISEVGLLADGEIEPFALTDEFADNFSFSFEEMNSTGDILITSFAGAAPISNIAGRDKDPVLIDLASEGIYFRPTGFNAAHTVVGSWQAHAGLDISPAIWEAGVLTGLEELLPANHGYHLLQVNGISDEGVISGSGWDEDGGFHPLLFVPA